MAGNEAVWHIKNRASFFEVSEVVSNRAIVCNHILSGVEKLVEGILISVINEPDVRAY